ncbi:MAG: pantetheine-phosphate adenylyltransferase [Candidatus Nealsonbacteria bacterium]
MKKIKGKTVVVGGTFDVLHKGHTALLKKAFSLGRVILGLTSDKYVKRKRRSIKSYVERNKNLKEFIDSNFSNNFEIYKTEDRFGVTLEKDFDYIVVSPETFKTAKEINKKRKKIGRKSIKIIKIPFVLGKDGKPISSSSLAFSYEGIIKKLKSLANKKNREGMIRFGISSKNTLGISTYFLRDIAKEIGKNHNLALKLWDSKIHEARLLAGFIADPKKLTEKEMEKWVKKIDSWDICDQVCSSLFDKTIFAKKKVFEWTKRKEEFVKRSGFALIAVLSIHDKEASNAFFEKFFPIIKREAIDERNFVKKAVNWALRQIGKRNLVLNGRAIKVATDISKIDSKSAKWIASNALTELNIKRKLMQKSK